MYAVLGKRGCAPLYICHRVHFQLLMNIMISPQLNEGQYGALHWQPRSNNSSFHYLIIAVSVFFECILLLGAAVVVVMVFGSLTHSHSDRPCISAWCIHFTMKMIWAYGIRLFATVIYLVFSHRRTLRAGFPCRNSRRFYIFSKFGRCCCCRVNFVHRREVCALRLSVLLHTFLRGFAK